MLANINCDDSPNSSHQIYVCTPTAGQHQYKLSITSGKVKYVTHEEIIMQAYKCNMNHKEWFIFVISSALTAIRTDSITFFPLHIELFKILMLLSDIPVHQKVSVVASARSRVPVFFR